MAEPEKGYMGKVCGNDLIPSSDQKGYPPIQSGPGGSKMPETEVKFPYSTAVRGICARFGVELN